MSLQKSPLRRPWTPAISPRCTPHWPSYAHTRVAPEKGVAQWADTIAAAARSAAAPAGRQSYAGRGLPR